MYNRKASNNMRQARSMMIAIVILVGVAAVMAGMI